MPYCPASSQSGTGMKKLTMPEQVRYQTKPTQSGIFGSGTGLKFWMPECRCPAIVLAS